MQQDKIRNIAIIAHVDHGKTTLVDQLFQQTGSFRSNQVVAERLMDSIDVERERGITIAAKNGSFQYGEHFINIIDTPGHADFGGQVERILKMADGALLLVDAQEGPMPQTLFVLKKALAIPLPILVVINKIDKPAARIDWAVDQVFDLFCKLGAPDHILDFPIVYASGRDGYAMHEPTDPQVDLRPLCDAVVDKIPPPAGDPDGPAQLLVSSIDYSPYLGRLGIGKITSGKFQINQDTVVVQRDGSSVPARITKLYRFRTNEKEPIEAAGTGEIVAVAGGDDVTVGVTFTDPASPIPLPPLDIDPPTISMTFMANNSPFAGREGQFLTPRHLRERLDRETLSDVALDVESLGEGNGFKVSGRGELHLSILIERMRREGYEFQVTRPQVIMRRENGKLLEPLELLTIDVDKAYTGAVIENVGQRRGVMVALEHEDQMVRMVFTIPTRGLLGFRSELLTDTRGTGIMNYVFNEYAPHLGEIKTRVTGAIVAMQDCTTVAYALFNLQERGTLFCDPGIPVYQGQIVGEYCREGDLTVNPAKGKKLTNVRASGTDEGVVLTPPRQMTLEDCITFIKEDELVEVTPAAVRLRKIPAG